MRTLQKSRARHFDPNHHAITPCCRPPGTNSSLDPGENWIDDGITKSASERFELSCAVSNVQGSEQRRPTCELWDAICTQDNRRSRCWISQTLVRANFRAMCMINCWSRSFIREIKLRRLSANRDSLPEGLFSLGTFTTDGLLP